MTFVSGPVTFGKTDFSKSELSVGSGYKKHIPLKANHISGVAHDHRKAHVATFATAESV